MIDNIKKTEFAVYPLVDGFYFKYCAIYKIYIACFNKS